MKNSTPAIFIVGSQELIATRIDVSFHKPEIKQILKKIPFNVVPLRSILREDLKNGSTPTGGKFLQEGIPFIRSQDYNIEEIRINQYISIDFHKKLKRSIILPGDILLSVVGATLGNVGIVRNELKEGNINQNIVRIRIKNNVNPFYVAYFLYSNIGQKLLLRLSTVTTQQYLNNEVLETLPIPLPPLEIQNKIVTIMDTAFKEKREKENEAQNLLNSIDNYLLQELGITLPKIKEKSPLIYGVGCEFFKKERWDVEYWKPKYIETEKAIKSGKHNAVEFGSLIDTITNGLDYRKFIDEGTKYLRVGNIKPFAIDDTDIKHIPLSLYDVNKDILLEKSDILLTRKGTFGVAAIVENEDNYIISSEIFRIRLKKKSNINIFYIVTVLNSILGRYQFSRKSVGAIMGSLSQEAVKSIFLPLPPRPVQDKIANEVKRRIETAKELEKKGKQITEKAREKIEKIILGERNYE